MEMVLAFLGFLACLIALGYGLYHLVRYVLKKEKRFSKRLFGRFSLEALCCSLPGQHWQNLTLPQQMPRKIFSAKRRI